MARTSALACSVHTKRLAIAAGRDFGLTAHLFPVLHGQSELGENFFVRDGRVVLQPLVGFGDGFAIRFAQGLVVDGRTC
jgi:hypothetical protein